MKNNPLNKNVTTIDIVFIIIYFIILMLAAGWFMLPVFNHAEPFILGLPFSYFYQVFLAYCWVAAIICQYALETKRGDADPIVDPDHNYLEDEAILNSGI